MAIAFTSNAAAGRPERIILENADTIRTEGPVRYLIGNVRIHHKQKTITSDRAMYDSETGLLNLSGNVELWESEQQLNAKRVSYYEQSGDYEAAGGVDYTKKDSIRIRCRWAQYFEREDVLHLYDDVIINILQDNSTIAGSGGEWINTEEIAVIEGNPVYRLPDKNENSSDTLVINSRQISYYRKENSALFTGDVELQRDRLLAVSDSLYHYPDSGYTQLTGAPMIWRDEDKMSGDKIDLFSENDELTEIEVTDNAVILSDAHELDDRVNRLAGRLLKISVINDSSRVVKVEGDAEGEYHIYDEDDVYQGVNLSAADVIKIHIENNEVVKIDLDGGTSGAFYPPDMAPPSGLKP